MIDISNITYKDKNLKTIEGCMTLSINHKYSENFTVTFELNTTERAIATAYSPMCHRKVFKIG